MDKPPKVLLITLRTFSLTGGIEKVCRGMGHVLQQMHEQGSVSFNMLSFYDAQADENYVTKTNFKGFNGSKFSSTLAAIREGINSDIVIMSHINLCPAGLAIKAISPKTKVIMWAHGIEIWREFNWMKNRFLKVADKIVAVSRYTAGTLTGMHRVAADRIQVIPNALDPYFEVPDLGTGSSAPLWAAEQIEAIREKNGLGPGKKIFIALTRLKGTEKHKNYDKVIRILGALKKEGKNAYYLLCGKYDQAEYDRITSIAKEAGMQESVILTGFIPDAELAAYYLLADAFVLPSTKEGFGIAFAEAQACGLYVLAGNKDGSAEAVKNEVGGHLIDPTNEKEIENGLRALIDSTPVPGSKKNIQKQAIEHFSFNIFKNNIEQLIREYAN